MIAIILHKNIPGQDTAQPANDGGVIQWFKSGDPAQIGLNQSVSVVWFSAA